MIKWFALFYIFYQKCDFKIQRKNREKKKLHTRKMVFICSVVRSSVLDSSCGSFMRTAFNILSLYSDLVNQKLICFALMPHSEIGFSPPYLVWVSNKCSRSRQTTKNILIGFSFRGSAKVFVDTSKGWQFTDFRNHEITFELNKTLLL